jgi:hypothetical protein
MFRYYGDRLRRSEGSTGSDVATQREEQRQNYRDLRERTKRHEHSREERLERIVELHRERWLHSFEHEGWRTAGAIPLAA